MNEEQRLLQKRLRVLEHAQKIGNNYVECQFKIIVIAPISRSINSPKNT